MLVLARQLNERIVMPTVPATIEVVAIKPNGIRLGIEAPPQVTILREEVLRRGGVPSDDLLPPTETDSTRLHHVRQVVRNRLQGVALGLALVREQLDDPNKTEPQAMLQRIETEVRRLDRQLHELLRTDADVCLVVETPTAFSI